jgi:hypothetical protein
MPPDEDLDGAFNQSTGPALRGLLDTKTGRDLLIPFVERFPKNEPVTIQEIARITRCEEGTDRMRKCHSLIAGLGRWEQPRNVKIFDQIPGKPKRYRMSDVVRVLLTEELDDRARKSGK